MSTNKSPTTRPAIEPGKVREYCLAQVDAQRAERAQYMAARLRQDRQSREAKLRDELDRLFGPAVLVGRSITWDAADRPLIELEPGLVLRQQDGMSGASVVVACPEPGCSWERATRDYDFDRYIKNMEELFDRVSREKP